MKLSLTSEAPSKAELSQWLDGRKFAAWLEERFTSEQLQAPQISETTTRRLREAKLGVSLHVYVADRILIALGCHLHQLPDDVWCKGPRVHRDGTRGRPSVSGAAKKQAVDTLRSGLTLAETAAKYGVARDTVRHWNLLTPGAKEPERIDVSPYRERFVTLRARDKMRLSDLAFALGWFNNKSTGGPGNTGRVRRTLGLPTVGPPRNHWITRETADKLAKALNMSPIYKRYHK